MKNGRKKLCLHHFRTENWNGEWDKVGGSQLKWSPDLNLSSLYFYPWWFMEIMESIEHYLSEATLTGVIQIRNMPFTCKDVVITSIYSISDDADVKGLWMGQKVYEKINMIYWKLLRHMIWILLPWNALRFIWKVFFWRLGPAGIAKDLSYFLSNFLEKCPNNLLWAETRTTFQKPFTSFLLKTSLPWN